MSKKEERYNYVFEQYDGDSFIYDLKEDKRIDDLSQCAYILNKYEAKLAEYQNDGVGDVILNAGKKIKELERQLAEKDAEVQSWKDGTMVVKLGKLEEQLAEKEKEKQDWIRAFEELALDSIDHESYNATVDEYEKEIEELKIYQNQTAIVELNNILDTFAIFVNEEKESMVSPDGNGNLSLLEYIENRIDALKGEK